MNEKNPVFILGGFFFFEKFKQVRVSIPYSSIARERLKFVCVDVCYIEKNHRITFWKLAHNLLNNIFCKISTNIKIF